MITFRVFNTPIEAHMLKTKLESEGIPCFLQDEHIVSINPLYNYAVGGIKLNIWESDQEEAEKILEHIEQTYREEGEAGNQEC